MKTLTIEQKKIALETLHDVGLWQREGLSEDAETILDGVCDILPTLKRLVEEATV